MSNFLKKGRLSNIFKKASLNAKIATGRLSATAGLVAGVITGDVAGGLNNRVIGNAYADVAKAQKAALKTPKPQ